MRISIVNQDILYQIAELNKHPMDNLWNNFPSKRLRIYAILTNINPYSNKIKNV